MAWGWWIPSALAMAGAIALPVTHVLPLRAALALALAMIAGAIAMRPSQDDVVFRERDGDAPGNVPLTPVKMLGGMLIIVAAAIPKPRGPLWGADLGVLLELASAVTFFLLGAASYRRARQMVTAKRWTGGTGERVLVAGTVRAAEPVDVDGKRAALGIHGKYESISKDKFRDTRTFHAADTFAIETEHGRVVVAPEGLLWATTILEIYDQQKSSRRYRHLVPDGAAAAALGVVEDDGGTLRLARRDAEGTGGRRLLAATDAGGDPLVAVRSLAAYWRGTLIGLALVAVAWVGLVVADRAGVFETKQLRRDVPAERP